MVGRAHPGTRRVGHAGHAVLGDIARPVISPVSAGFAREATVCPVANRHRARCPVTDVALIVTKHKVEEHQIHLLHFAVKRTGVGSSQQPLDAQYRGMHFVANGAQAQHMLALGAQAIVVGDHRATAGVSHLQGVLALTTRRGFVLDADGFCDHTKWHAFAPVEVMGRVGRIDGFHIQVLHVAVGIRHAERHVRGPPHHDARHARQRRAHGLDARGKQSHGVPGAGQNAVVQVRVVHHHGLARLAAAGAHCPVVGAKALVVKRLGGHGQAAPLQTQRFSMRGGRCDQARLVS